MQSLVYREKSSGERTRLRSSSADRPVLNENFPSLTSCCLSVIILIYLQVESSGPLSLCLYSVHGAAG